MNTKTSQQWLDLVHELGPEFASRQAQHDQDDSFVSENYAALKRHGFFAATIPEELGGGGVSHATMCDLLRTLARYCGSTALAHSMHQHLLAATIWKYRHGQGGEKLLAQVAANQPVLVSTGARDWLESSGEAVRCDGGFRVKATKRFASQSAIGDLLVTSAAYRSPEDGWQVLHFAVPMKTEGVCVLNDWHTLGMRGTGSHTVRLEGVFIPEAGITLRRPRGEFHPVFNVIVTVALPLIMSVYVGLAQKAAHEAIEFAKRQAHPKAHLPDALGGMMNELTAAEVQLRDMIRLANDLDFQPANQLGQDILSRKTNVANACVGVVTPGLSGPVGPPGSSRGRRPRLAFTAPGRATCPAGGAAQVRADGAPLPPGRRQGSDPGSSCPRGPRTPSESGGRPGPTNVANACAAGGLPDRTPFAVDRAGGHGRPDATRVRCQTEGPVKQPHWFPVVAVRAPSPTTWG